MATPLVGQLLLPHRLLCRQRLALAVGSRGRTHATSLPAPASCPPGTERLREPTKPVLAVRKLERLVSLKDAHSLSLSSSRMSPMPNGGAGAANGWRLGPGSELLRPPPLPPGIMAPGPGDTPPPKS